MEDPEFDLEVPDNASTISQPNSRVNFQIIMNCEDIMLVKITKSFFGKIS